VPDSQRRCAFARGSCAALGMSTDQNNLSVRIMLQTETLQFEVTEGFVHTPIEPRFFVVRLSDRHRGFKAGYQFEVQLLNDDGTAGAVLNFNEPYQAFQMQSFYVPASVMAAAVGQLEGKGDYVDSYGESRRPF
jgi:hypothetical protein